MTIELANRKILNDGTVICSESALLDLLYSGQDINGLFCDKIETQLEWQAAGRICDSQEQGPVFVNCAQYDNISWYQHWFTPEPWQSIDLRNWCLAKCSNTQETDRVNYEIDEFEKRNMIPIMKHLIYCVDKWRENQIVWGVGRGSSVSSFVLFLIGVNRINPLEFDLNISEWLKASG